MNFSLTPYPYKHLLILSTTYPCHVLLDPLLFTPINSHSPTHTYAHFSFICYNTDIHKLHTCPYCTSLGYVLPSHPRRLSSLPRYSDRWAEPWSLCSRDRAEGKKALSPFSVCLLKTTLMANKNTAQGIQMATRTVVAIVVWNVSHDLSQERRIRWMTQPWNWETGVRLRWCAEDVMI